jgi:hypothetical protein
MPFAQGLLLPDENSLTRRNSMVRLERLTVLKEGGAMDGRKGYTERPQLLPQVAGH